MTTIQTDLIYGMHEKCPLDVMPDGWVLYIAEVGDSNDPHQGIDLSDEQRARMIRIQWRFGSDGGCYSPPDRRDGFIQRVESLAANTPDCHVWVGGNEPNLFVEGLFTPEYTADMYKSIRVAIQEQPGHEKDIVLLPPVGPWNVEIGYGWIEYFARLIDLCPEIDGFALHTYARWAEPASITSEDKMDPPYDHLYNGFRTYRDWLATIPARFRDCLVYITETNQNDAWENRNRGWVQAAYKEIDGWNQAHKEQPIRSLMLYRWPHYDKYGIEGLTNVELDFKLAQTHGYSVPEKGDPPMAENVIKNPTFSPPYYEDGAGEMKVAHEWKTWYDHNLRRWEWRQAAVDFDGAQQWFETDDKGDGGVRQRIHVGPGAIGKYFHVIATVALKSLNTGSGIGEYYASIGIDRLGEEDYRRQTVTWTTPQHQALVPKWTDIELIAPIEGEHVTVYLRAWNKYAVSGSMFAVTCYGYVIDDPCDGSETDPPPDGPPGGGECDLRQLYRAKSVEHQILRDAHAEIAAVYDNLANEL